jgi:hypothetical protein
MVTAFRARSKLNLEPATTCHLTQLESITDVRRTRDPNSYCGRVQLLDRQQAAKSDHVCNTCILRNCLLIPEI